MELLLAPARALFELCRRKHLTLATAESCTGGLVAATLTEIPGSSEVVERGFVTYAAMQASTYRPCVGPQEATMTASTSVEAISSSPVA